MGSRSPFPATNTIPATHAYELGPGLACPAISRQEGLALLGSSVHHDRRLATHIDKCA